MARLTGREQEVCLRILAGFSSEAISADLDIGLQSTLTYRKRAYQKLGISSQSELFAIVLRLLASPPRPELRPNLPGEWNRPAVPTHRDRHPAHPRLLCARRQP